MRYKHRQSTTHTDGQSSDAQNIDPAVVAMLKVLRSTERELAGAEAEVTTLTDLAESRRRRVTALRKVAEAVR